MALPVIARTFRVALAWVAAPPASAVNVMHFRTTSSGHTPGDVYNCINAHVTAAMWKTVSDGAAVQTVTVTPLDGSGATLEALTGEPVKWTGGTPGNPIPQSAGIVKLTTALRGRSFRGRVFLPFTSEGAQNAGAIDATLAAAATTAWNVFAGAIGADATTPMSIVVASYKLAAATDVEEIGVELETGTQRRRQTRLR